MCSLVVYPMIISLVRSISIHGKEEPWPLCKKLNGKEEEVVGKYRSIGKTETETG